MIENAADTIASATRIARHLGEVSMERRTKGGREPWLAVLRAELEVYEDVGERLWHG